MDPIYDPDFGAFVLVIVTIWLLAGVTGSLAERYVPRWLDRIGQWVEKS